MTYLLNSKYTLICHLKTITASIHVITDENGLCDSNYLTNLPAWPFFLDLKGKREGVEGEYSIGN